MDKKKLLGFYRGLEQLRLMRKDHQGMPIQMATVFLYVSLNDGCPMKDIADALAISQPACSRLVATLGDTYRDASNKPQKGEGLLEAREDPADRRSKIVKLTANGRKIIDQLNAVLS
jgi:DNA-binding MarR family transcriptional regulator